MSHMTALTHIYLTVQLMAAHVNMFVSMLQRCTVAYMVVKILHCLQVSLDRNYFHY